jgi:uridine kinase
MEERAKTNFDHPDNFEATLLAQHLRELKEGRIAVLPTYDFTTRSRTPVTAQVTPKRIIIVDGTLIFTHPELVKELDIKVFVVCILFVNTQSMWRYC